MSPLLRSALKRRSWRTLPGLVIASAMLFELWQISLTFHGSHPHARFPLGALRTTLQKDFHFASSGASEVEMLLEEAIEKVVSSQDLPKEAMILQLQTLVEELRQKPNYSLGSCRIDMVDDGFAYSKVNNADCHSRNPERVEKHLQTVLMEKVRATYEQLQHDLEVLRSENENLKSQFVSQPVETPPTWKSLKDLSKFSIRGFLSDILDRRMARGPPQLFEFPSALSHGRLLCFLGNSTSNGTQNSYTLRTGGLIAEEFHLS